jgi:hypothetical protein
MESELNDRAEVRLDGDDGKRVMGEQERKKMLNCRDRMPRRSKRGRKPSSRT